MAALRAALMRLAPASAVGLLEHDGQQIELLLPVPAVAVDPDGRGEDRSRDEAAPADAAGARLRDESRLHQYLYVARHRLKRDVEGLGEFRDEQRLRVEPRQDAAPDGVRQREENAVEKLLIGIRRLAQRPRGICRHEGKLSTSRLIVNESIDLFLGPPHPPSPPHWGGEGG